MTANALIDWCAAQSTLTSYIDPGAPWQNPFVESFHSRVRDELLNLELFSCLAEARVVIEDWREDFNRHGRTPPLAARLPPSSLLPGRYPHPPPDPHRTDARGRKPAARLASGLASAAGFRPRQHLACPYYIHPALTAGGPKNGVRPTGALWSSVSHHGRTNRRSSTRGEAAPPAAPFPRESVHSPTAPRPQQ